MKVKRKVSMGRTGILMHSRHLGTVEWERLVWGVPEEDSIGSLPKVVELLLEEPECEPIATILFGCGPSTQDDLSEGEYTKQYLLDHLPELRAFPRFANRLDDMTLKRLQGRLEQIQVTEQFTRSIDEVVIGARLFEAANITRVLQITSASHAPRCMQVQAAARAQGLIPKSQQWSLIADDRCYEGADPFSTAVFETPHRDDDPMHGFAPTLPEAMKAYQYGLTPDDKKRLIHLIKGFMQEYATDNDVRQFGSHKT